MDTLITDFSHIEGTCLYCSAESAETIRDALSHYPSNCVHLLGTGDYHYLSLFNIERLEQDFCLVLFDNHSDDQTTAFGGDILSCGSWVLHARRLPHLKQDIWIQKDSDCSKLARIDYPVYISIDLDVLSKDFARTDWNQGEMSISTLLAALKSIDNEIIGVDICGGLSAQQNPSSEDLSINRACYGRLKEYFDGL